MKKVGLVGWRGMVGSVLMQRMVEEGDFAHIDPVYFSTSAAGGKAPVFGGKEASLPLQDASNIEALKACEIIITCRAATTPRKSSPSCAPPAGTATGSMPPRRCAWLMTP